MTIIQKHCSAKIYIENYCQNQQEDCEMKIGYISQTWSCEYEMQDQFEKYLQFMKSEKEDWHSYIMEPIICFKREVQMKEVNRIADFLILSGTRLVNVEAKCFGLDKLIKQLDDHAKYADYCFAFIPSVTITPDWFKRQLVEKGYGLIVFDYVNKTVCEVLESHKNKNTDKALRRKAIDRIK